MLRAKAIKHADDPRDGRVALVLRDIYRRVAGDGVAKRRIGARRQQLADGTGVSGGTNDDGSDDGSDDGGWSQLDRLSWYQLSRALVSARALERLVTV